MTDNSTVHIIAGIDEAGRGPLAGRVYAAAVIFHPHQPITGLNDSKKLSPVKRDLLYRTIIDQAAGYGIGYALPDEIDQLNILQASFLAMRRALTAIDIPFQSVWVDGNHYPFKNQYPGKAIIRGDSLIPEIMAASILAKVSRDRYMDDMNQQYPEYQFSRHKGYPTVLHRELIRKYGPSPIHRKTFRGVKEFL